MKMQIPESHLAAFLACLGLGTLYAIREGTIPVETGIWTLGAPHLWEKLEGNDPTLQEIGAVFQECDELSAIQQLLPDRLTPIINDLMNRLEQVLRETEDPSWHLTLLADE